MNRVRDVFDAAGTTTLEQVDLRKDSTRVDMNQQISALTRNTIRELFPEHSLSLSAKMVLVNALYFKGSWNQQFNPAYTEKVDFQLINNKSRVTVDMMYKSMKVKRLNLPDLDCRLVDLPYQNERLSMLFFLSNTLEGFYPMENKVTNNLDVHSLTMPPKKIRMDMLVPRFKLKSSHDVAKAMTLLGFQDIFNQRDSDFGDLSSDSSLTVADMKQELSLIHI